MARFWLYPSVFDQVVPLCGFLVTWDPCRWVKDWQGSGLDSLLQWQTRRLLSDRPMLCLWTPSPFKVFATQIPFKMSVNRVNSLAWAFLRPAKSSHGKLTTRFVGFKKQRLLVLIWRLATYFLGFGGGLFIYSLSVCLGICGIAYW